MSQHNFLTITASILAGLTLVACGGSETPPATQTEPEAIETTQSNPVAETSGSSSNSAPAANEMISQEALLKRGRIVWFKCRSCHETSADGPNKVGPNLHGLMDAEAGVKDGFVYSQALLDSGIVWDEESLDAFIEKPTAYVKGTKMAFIGIKKESDRKALIEYIKETTKPAE